MSSERRDRDLDPLLEPEDGEDGSDAAEPQAANPDPNDEIPVPIAMFPSEIDERAQVVEALREEEQGAGENATEQEPPRTES